MWAQLAEHATAVAGHHLLSPTSQTVTLLARQSRESGNVLFLSLRLHSQGLICVPLGLHVQPSLLAASPTDPVRLHTCNACGWLPVQHVRDEMTRIRGARPNPMPTIRRQLAGQAVRTSASPRMRPTRLARMCNIAACSASEAWWNLRFGLGQEYAHNYGPGGKVGARPA